MTDLVPPVGIGLAFFAGVISFLSPCCTPLVPGYLSYISGTAFARTGELKLPFLLILSYTVLFILGFTLVFVSLGTSASALGFFLESYRRELTRLAGMVMIIMGILVQKLFYKLFYW